MSYALEYADEESRCWAHGAEKHGQDDWKRPELQASEYLDAIVRHAERIKAGELIDQSSGLPHAAHIVVDAKIFGVKTRRSRWSEFERSLLRSIERIGQRYRACFVDVNYPKPKPHDQ